MQFRRVLFLNENGRFSYGDVTAEKGLVTSVRFRNETPPADADYLIPGLIDLHLHGCAGADFCDGNESNLERMSIFLKDEGVAGFCPATMSLSKEKLLSTLKKASGFSRKKAPGAQMLGITLEGPFLNPQKCGAQTPDYLALPSIPLFEELLSACEGQIRTVCLAPELPEAFSLVRHAVSKGIAVSLAHTACDYDTAAAAFDAGVSRVTHLLNAMAPFHHRSPGVLGAAAERETVAVELIGDGLHVHPSAVRLIFHLFGANRICLISDSMAACGLSDGKYILGGQAVTVHNGRASLSDGTLAGSTKSLFEILQTVIRMGVDPADAVISCTRTPAHRLRRLGEFGTIAPGRPARLVLCSAHWERKEVFFDAD